MVPQSNNNEMNTSLPFLFLWSKFSSSDDLWNDRSQQTNSKLGCQVTYSWVSHRSVIWWVMNKLSVLITAQANIWLTFASRARVFVRFNCVQLFTTMAPTARYFPDIRNAISRRIAKPLGWSFGCPSFRCRSGPVTFVRSSSFSHRSGHLSIPSPSLCQRWPSLVSCNDSIYPLDKWNYH